VELILEGGERISWTGKEEKKIEQLEYSEKLQNRRIKVRLIS
jgi:hypothetical protein